MEQENTSSVRAAIQPSALRAALIPHRPVFGNPWDSEVDMFAVLRGGQRHRSTAALVRRAN